MRDDKFYHQGICQVMYPKELVYPRSGGEASLEMIRAKMEKYQVLPEDVNDSVMEFTCMPGDPINTLKGLPVYKGRSNVEHPIQLAQVCGSAHIHCDGYRLYIIIVIRTWSLQVTCLVFLPRTLHLSILLSTNCCSHSRVMPSLPKEALAGTTWTIVAGRE